MAKINKKSKQVSLSCVCEAKGQLIFVIYSVLFFGFGLFIRACVHLLTSILTAEVSR